MPRIIRVLIAGGISVVAAPLVAFLVALSVLVYLPLPAAVPPANVINLGQDNFIYDSAGAQIAQFGQFSHQIPVAASAIPAIVKDAVVASEDRNFYQEGGLSFSGIIRALTADVNGQPIQGGSTITQQYVKQVYTNASRTLGRKLQEALLAKQVSRTLTKDQILYNYLSIVYFGEGAYGIGAAAEEYFRTPVSKLDASQAALLAAVIPAPSDYDPLINLTLGEQRRETVLGLMQAQGYLSSDQYTQAMDQQLALPGQAGPGQPVTYVYPPVPQTTKYPFFTEYVKQFLALHLSAQQLAEGGLRVQTTLDPTLQAQAEASVAKSLKGTSPPLQMALAAVQPASGYVKAMVGGRDFQVSQVNLALGGCPGTSVKAAADTLVVAPSCAAQPVPTGGGAGRQAGSSFKPFTLAAALTQGLSPQTVYYGPVVYKDPGCSASTQDPRCFIRNAGDGEGGGSYSITQATWYSINTVYAQIINQVGIKNVAEMAKKLGITSANDITGPDGYGLSYTLGVIGVSPLDMASAYSTFADLGLHIPPSPVVRVVDASGRTIYDDTHPQGTRVISNSVAGAVNSILQGVLTQPGATAAGKGINRPAAGKTGTTDNYTDAWFVGYTPDLSTAVWMGYENNESTSLVNLDGVPQVFGGTIPASTWQDFMSKALAKVPPANFAQAPPLIPPADVLARQQFGGFLPGPEQIPTPTPDTGFLPGPPSTPATTLPPTTTSTSTTSTSTAPFGSPPSTSPFSTTSSTGPGLFGIP